MRELGFPDAVLSWLSRPPGYKRLLQSIGESKQGENLLEKDWDLCIVLDACRADILQSLLENDDTQWSLPHEWSWSTTTSVDSHTIPWLRTTFNEDVSATAEPATYVTATPQSVEVEGSSKIVHLDEVWRYGWDDSIGTVPPHVVTDRAIHHCRNSANRVMMHYLQPHVPLLTRNGETLRPYFKSNEGDHPAGAVTPPAGTEKTRSESRSLFDRLPGEWEVNHGESDYLFDRLRNDDVDRQTAWEGYRETLDIVLEDVSTLLRSVDAETVVITADHGNAFGEWGLYGHPYHMPVSVLREVPYVTTSAVKELDYEPAEYETDSEVNREDQLKALGYR